MAWVRALIAERRTTPSILIASTGPSPLLGWVVACPLRAARAAFHDVGFASGAAQLPVGNLCHLDTGFG